MATRNKQAHIDELSACEEQLRFFKDRFPMAYANTLGNKIRILWDAHQRDAELEREYFALTRFSPRHFYWPEHFRHPFLINRLTWKIIKAIYVLLHK